MNPLLVVLIIIAYILIGALSAALITLIMGRRTSSVGVAVRVTSDDWGLPALGGIFWPAAIVVGICYSLGRWGKRAPLWLYYVVALRAVGVKQLTYKSSEGSDKIIFTKKEESDA